MGNGIGVNKPAGTISYQDVKALKAMFKILAANKIDVNLSQRSPVFYRQNHSLSVLDIAGTKATQIVKMFNTTR